MHALSSRDGCGQSGSHISRWRSRFSGRGESQAGNDDEMFEFKAGGNDVLAEGNQVVLVGSTDFLNRSVKAQAFEGGTFEPWSWR